MTPFNRRCSRQSARARAGVHALPTKRRFFFSRRRIGTGTDVRATSRQQLNRDLHAGPQQNQGVATHVQTGSDAQPV